MARPGLTAATLIVAAVLATTAFIPAVATTDPSVIQSPAEAPLFAQEIEDAKRFLDTMMTAGVVVPVPKDPGGGYTHEQHKLNYKAIHDGGELYRVTGDRKYADYVRDVLLAYADLYPTLGPHPARANEQYGKLFWQNLNDAVWLVNSVQGYAAIRDTLTAAQRLHIDNDLFRNAAKFMSVEAVATFDRIHNHATWSTAGVGMTGYLLGDKELVQKALLGSKKDGKAGFLRQLDELFSPDGYYTEGPYYQRYALQPFVVFADAISRNDPDRHIFERRDNILLKAIHTSIEQTYAGHFFPLNDALKDKSLDTEELYQAVAIGYAHGRDPALLSIAKQQGGVAFSDEGRTVAQDLAAGLAKPFPFRSIFLRDGAQGDLGGVAIMRRGDSSTGQALVAKNTSQGMGHGHFDKLTWQFYDDGNEIVSDYGAARFLNIEAKEGGRYLPENESWAKQSVAHNVLVVDEKSHFNGSVKTADRFAPKQLFFKADEDFSVSTAQIDTASDGVAMIRSLALVAIPGLETPVTVDLMRVRADAPHRYDLPLHYLGHIIRQGGGLESHVTVRPVLGNASGYQHIWVDAEGQATADQAFLTWMTGNRFYTWRWVPVSGSKAILGEIGANDPNFDLRREPMLIQRVDAARDVLFAGVLEPHGRYDGATEQTIASDSQIRSIQSASGDGTDAVLIETLKGVQVAVAIAYDQDPAALHSLTVGSQQIEWRGPAARIVLPERGR